MRTEILVNGKLVTKDDGSIEFTNRFGKLVKYDSMGEYLAENKAKFEPMTEQKALDLLKKMGF